MVGGISGRLSDLVLVRLHRQAAAYASAGDEARAALVAQCRRDATVGDLAERILGRTIYAQSSTRLGPFRELLQNALDASPRGGRIDVRSSAPADGGHREVTVVDRGRGMTRAELLEDLLVPFRSGKEGDPDTIGEHGIGFLSALEIAPRIEVTTTACGQALRLALTPIGDAPPYRDFAFSLVEIDPHVAPGSGTTVHLLLDRAIAPGTLAQEIAAAAGLVDPAAARIYVNGEPINTARARLRRVARVPVGAMGDLELYVGRGEGVAPRFVLTQKGLLVVPSLEPFAGPPLALHRDLLRALTAAGFGLVADLPLGVPLTKGRAAVAAIAAREAEQAIVAAFERFVLEDALYDRDLLRGVDHRLGSVLDRLVGAALAGEATPALATAPEVDPGGDTPRAPTVAAPEQVVRFASTLVDAPLFVVAEVERGRGEVRRPRSLREVVEAHRRGLLRSAPIGREIAPGYVYIAATDPLAQALFQRLSVPAAPPGPARDHTPRPVPRLARERLLAAEMPWARALAAVLVILERIDGAISAAAGLAPSVLSVHQNLYGPDEMAHTDGTGISVNLASVRMRALLSAVLVREDPSAFGALVDLVLHEKAHVSLASSVPRANAEHGAAFYRRKDQLRRRLLEGIASGHVPDPFRALALARHGLASYDLPTPEALAAAFNPEPLAA
jgi:hypothetical protein